MLRITNFNKMMYAGSYLSYAGALIIQMIDTQVIKLS